MDCLHLLAASVWGGGLFVLSMAILPKIVKPGDHSARLIADVAGRFSKIAGLAVGIIVLTALYNEWVYVGSFEALLKTPYGRTVIVKIFLFFLLLNLGGFNRYISVPLLQEWAGISPDNRGIIHRIAAQFRTRFLGSPKGDRIALRFMHSVRVEAFLMIAVMLCAASLRHEIPARHLSHMEHHGEKMHSMGHNNGDNPHTH
jgi:putative copper export protein